jgi:hypothetical protein
MEESLGDTATVGLAAQSFFYTVLRLPAMFGMELWVAMASARDSLKRSR